jgi:Mycoplasma protein of unknown function, DUF285
MELSDEPVAHDDTAANARTNDETDPLGQAQEVFDEERSQASVEIVFELEGESPGGRSPESCSSLPPSVDQAAKDEASASLSASSYITQVGKKSESPASSTFKASPVCAVTSQTSTDLSRVSFEETVVHSGTGSLLDVKAAIAAARARSDDSSSVELRDRETAEQSKSEGATTLQSNDRALEVQRQDDRPPSNLSVHLDDRHTAGYDEETGQHTVTVSALAISDNEMDETREQIIREARETFLAEAARAEPVDPVQNPKRTCDYYVTWGLALCLAIATIVGVTVGVSNQKSNPSPVEPMPVAAGPTTAPLVVLEDGKIAFSTTQQLYDAVDAYLSEVEAGGFSNTSNVAVLYGYPIGKWDVSRITNFDRVFDPDRNLTLDPEWNSARRTSFNAALDEWDTSNAVSMKGMFIASDEFVGQGLERWNVSKVVDFSYMFGWAAKFNGDLSQWDTSNAETMNGMFFWAALFDGNLSLWDVSKVTTMSHMFDRALAFRGGDLTQWDVSSVVNMNSLFEAAISFNGDVSTWNTSSVMHMENTVSFLSCLVAQRRNK